MKKVIFTTLFLFFFMAGFTSAGQFGPTEPTAAQGKFSLGVGYFWEDTKFDVLDGNIRTKSNQVYVQGSFVPVKNLEIFGRLGGANLEIKDTDVDFKDGARLFSTLGAKFMFFETRMFGLGAFAQGTYHFQDYKDSFDGADLKIKNYYNIQAGLSGQVKLENFIIYGGAFWYYARATVDATGSSIEGISDSATLKEKAPIGGFLGVKIPFTKQIALNLEGQYRDEFSGGAFLSYAF
jgi:hypothetical protein